jgi:hypothetical protein
MSAQQVDQFFAEFEHAGTGRRLGVFFVHSAARVLALHQIAAEDEEAPAFVEVLPSQRPQLARADAEEGHQPPHGEQPVPVGLTPEALQRGPWHALCLNGA